MSPEEEQNLEDVRRVYEHSYPITILRLVGYIDRLKAKIKDLENQLEGTPK